MNAAKKPCLDELLLRWEELAEQGQEPRLEDLCAESPGLLDELQQRVRALQRMDALLDTDGPSSDTLDSGRGGPVSSAPAERSLTQHYTILHEVGRGGRANVYLAYDELLRRNVALKALRADSAGDATSRERLTREAQIISLLNHPGIVPVFGMGWDGNGSPFYCMRLVEHGTLRKEVNAVHSGTASQSNRRLEMLRLIRHFVDATQTIAYAHGRGVVHRDVKPENILVGAFGATFVVDWGLARRDRDLDPREPIGDDAPSSSVPLPGNAALTRTGAALGTPAYMSPEQAAGDSAADLIASDIFNLGATLYTVLTGMAPYDGLSLFEVTRKAQARDLVAPRSVSEWTRRHCDPALEAICLKAMARQPADRYPSAEALADDVERVLADQPVACYPEPISRRAGRWARQHRKLLTALTLILIGITVALAVGGWLIEQQRQRADRNFQMAHQAVSDSFIKISNDTLLREKELQPLRSDLLASSLRFFERLLTENEQEPEIQAEMADAALRAGIVRTELGQRDNGATLLLQADRLFRDLRRQTTDPVIPLQHAGCLRRLAAIRVEDDVAAALSLLNEARRMLQAEMASGSDSTRESIREELGEIFLAASRYADSQGDLRAADEYLDEIRGLWSEASGELPPAADGLVGRSGLARSDRLHRNGNPAEALSVLKTAIEHLERAARGNTNDPTLRLAVALAHDRAGSLLAELDRTAEALARWEQSAEMLQAVMLQRPHVQRYRDTFAEVCERSSDAAAQLQLPAAAVLWLEKAAAAQRFLGHESPAIQRKLAARQYELGLWHRGEGRIHEAHESFVAAIERLKGLGEANPALSQSLAGSLLIMGVDRWRTGNGLRALDSFTQATCVFRELQEDFPTVSAYQEGLAAAVMGEAMAHEMLEQYEEQIADCDLAIELMTNVVAADPENAQTAVGLGMAYFLLSGGYERTSQAEKAAESLKRARHALPESAEVLYEYARNYARQAELFGRDKPQYSEVDSALFQRYVTESLYCLEQALRLGLPSTIRPLRDPALLALRGEARFAELTHGLK